MRGSARITDENVQDMLREVRMALLEADVALPVVRDFIARVKDRALGAEVSGSLSPGQAFVGVVDRELAATMGEGVADLDLATQPPAVILMAGLQGAGKTTTTAKLAEHLIEKRRKKRAHGLDRRLPAGGDRAAEDGDAAGWRRMVPSSASDAPVAIARAALEHARRHYFDVLLVDTAGRLAIDEKLTAEIRDLHAALKPVETLFVVDAMQGQDAVNTAKAFKEALPLTGIVLTKMDGDSRGGAALSVRAITGAPIKFAGTSEKLDGLEVFDAERHAGRILGMGDIVGLVEEVEKNVDVAAAQKLADKVKAGDSFDLNDFLSQISQMKKMGGLGGLHGQATLAAVGARRPAGPGRDGARRARRPPHGGHHLLDDAARAEEARAAEGDAQAPHRRRRRRSGAGSQSSAQPVRADARHDEEDEGRRNDEDDEADGRA